MKLEPMVSAGGCKHRAKHELESAIDLGHDGVCSKKNPFTFICMFADTNVPAK